MERLKSFSHLNQKCSNEKHSNELLQAQAHIWNRILNFINSMTLKSAIQLGIPDIINKHGCPMTLPELTSALPIHPTKSHSIHRLMRMLVHSGFFAKKKLSKYDEEGYTLSNASQILLEDHLLSVKPFLMGVLDHVLFKPWPHLSTWFQNDNPTPLDTAHGMTFWDYGSHQPSNAHFFNAAMASDARLVTSVIIDHCKGAFEGLESFVDIRVIAPAFPHVEFIVLDLHHVVADLQGCKNLRYTRGDMFEAIPPADAV